MKLIVNFYFVIKLLSRILFMLAVSMLICTMVALIYHEATSPFLLSGAVALVLGLLLMLPTIRRESSQQFTKKDAYFTVTFSWLIIALAGTLPYLFSGSIPSFTDALFESMSGFTTTGSSILNDIEALPKSVLFWRSLTHWIGGIGIILLVIVVMPSFQIGGYQLFTMESSLQDKIKPKIRSVGKRLLVIYVLLTLAEVLMLLIGGMNLYESVCHAFGTVATGGFSPKNTSIANYSPYIQYVITFFMLLAGMNFIVHYFIFKGQFRRIKTNEEFWFYLKTVGVLVTITTLVLYFQMQLDFELSFRYAIFQVVSIVTCTGFATSDYLQWPIVASSLLFMAMFLGGSTGSTAGGIKMVRHLVLFKNIKSHFSLMRSRHAILPLQLNKRSLSHDENNTILGFIAVYLMVFLAGSFLLLLMGIDTKTAASSVATCMAGIGPGIGSVGPVSNFAHLPDMAKNLLTFLMLAGRLEIYTVLILFSPFYWEA
ncbi:TrkH family potassium uptake protein [Roseimarinus sediminis]|uniref:TrkH family potassium uptake protein n=1 Tax=Roseimarinus sediminis TaxID=1610899 RepID=UPI003D2409A3